MKTILHVVGAWGDQCRATQQNVNHLQSSSKQTHQDVVTCSGRNCQRCNGALYLFSRGRWSYVWRHRLSLLRVITTHRVIGLSPIASALGSVKLAALPAFHADITGRFSVKGKLSCWKTFMEAEDTITALGSLQEPQCIPRDEILVLVETFISQLYQPGTGISQVKELR